MLTPLPGDERTRACRYVHYVRPGWDPAGITAALTDLEAFVADPAELLIVMLEWARTRDSMLPAGVIGYVKTRGSRPAEPRTRPAPAVTDPVCTTCGSQLRNLDGSCNGCTQNTMADVVKCGPMRPAPPPFRPTVLPPADFRARVEAARTSVAANVRPPADQKENHQ